MSRRPIARSPDLLRLRDEGYDLDVVGGSLVIRDVPYATATREVRRGTLFMDLDLAGDVATKPTSHVAYWAGEHPCHHDGSRIRAFEHPAPPQDHGNGLRSDHMFSAKADYRDYHHKVTTYVGRIAGEAAEIELSAKAQTFPVVLADDGSDVFRYVNTAESRAGIGAANGRVAGGRVGIVGLGGTGAYVLDLVAKTPVGEIHLFDGDVLSQHNAFRAPGAPTTEQLAAKPFKVDHFASVYGAMRTGIFPHKIFLDADNARPLLDGLDFVFVCMDGGPAKRAVIEALSLLGLPFVETGMGLLLGDDAAVSGIARVTTSQPATRAEAAPHICLGSADAGGNDYSTNIQVAELNALSAALAVVSWKRIAGFYPAAGKQVYAGFSVRTGDLVTEGAG